MKNRVNKQIIKALSVGLAASMALQPVTAFAEDGEPVAPAQEPSASVPATEVVQQDVANGPADVAQAAADVVSHEAPAPSVGTPIVEGDAEAKPVDKGGDLQVTDADADVVTDDIAETAIAGEAGVIEKTVTYPNGWPVYEYINGKWVEKKEVTKDYAQNVIKEADDVAKDTSIDYATSQIDNVKKDLIIAENADVASDKAVDAAADTMSDIQKKTNDVEQTVNQALETANTLADNIKNATSVADAQKAYDDLTTLASDTADAVDTYNKALYGEGDNGGLMAKYAAARKVLENAQNRFDAAIGEYSDEENAGTGARGSIEAAEAKVAAAEKEVQDLENAIKDAKDNIERFNKAALDIAKLQEEISKEAKEGLDVSEKQDQLFVKVMQEYYAEQMLPENARYASLKKENGYFTVTYYLPGEGIKEQFFDYNTNENGEFVMYPKAPEEIGALERIAAYEKNHKVTLSDDQKEAFYYVDYFGNKHYRLKVEVEDSLVKVGDNYYLKGVGSYDTMTPVTPVAAPTSTSDISKVYGTKDAVSITNEEVRYTIDKDGHLVETTYADVTTTTYQKFVTNAHDYIKGGYSDEYKTAEVKNLKDDEKIVAVEVKDLESKQTYYVVTGNYTPSYVITLDNNTGICRRHDVDRWGEDGAKQLAKNDVINDILNGLSGYTATDNLNTNIKSWLHSEGETIYITGSVVVTKNGVEAREIKSGEFTNERDAKNDLINRINAALATDKPQSYATIHCENWFGGWDKKVGFTANAPSDADTETERYKKLSYYIEYIQNVNEKTQKGEKISQTVYYNSKRAYEIIQDALMNNSDYALNVDQYEEIKKAKELFDKYDRYSKEAAQVQADIDKTQKDIDTLEEAIDDLSAKHGNKTAGEVLVDVDDFADYFKVSDDFIMKYFSDEPWEEIKNQGDEALKEKIDGYKDSLKDMTVDEFTKFLDALKDAAEAKKGEIESLLKVVQKQRDDSQNDLNDTINRLTPPSSGDDDDTTTGGGGDDTTIFIPVAVTPATNVVTPVVENANPAVLGARTTRRTAAKSAADTDTTAVDNSNNDNAAVAGAQKEEAKTPEAPKEETKIEDNETALAATPELEEKGFAWWWLLILAAIAGVSVEEYARRKSNKAKAEAKDSTKINK